MFYTDTLFEIKASLTCMPTVFQHFKLPLYIVENWLLFFYKYNPRATLNLPLTQQTTSRNLLLRIEKTKETKASNTKWLRLRIPRKGDDYISDRRPKQLVNKRRHSNWAPSLGWNNLAPSHHLLRVGNKMEISCEKNYCQH